MSKALQEFTNYMNDFYGVKGIYPSGRNLTIEQVTEAVEKMPEVFPGATFEGDSVDRERCRDILFSKEELKRMYE